MIHIRRVRLINFHNFVDETIDVERGGHLFLLGDNGSGKTTVLDAVHCVLSGAATELNAAARVAGPKSEGRTLQGIALRHDFERGVRCEGGAIAYAALELDEGGRPLTIGVGIEATTLEARVAKWGFVVSSPLAEVSLIRESEGHAYAVTREGLREALGASAVHYRISDYRAAIAARLFGGAARYQECCRFWDMAVAYRQIVSSARDVGGLFRRLLPAPDPAIFSEIVRSLRSIGDMQTALSELEVQRNHVGDLIGLTREVANSRAEASKYRWLACHRRIEHINSELAASRRRDTELTITIDGVANQVDAAEARIAAADAALRAAEAKDAEGLAGKIREASHRYRELACDLEERRQEAARASDAAQRAESASIAGQAALEAVTNGSRRQLEAATSAWCADGGELASGQCGHARSLLAAMHGGQPQAWLADRERAEHQAAALEKSCASALASSADRRERDRSTCEQAQSALAALEARAEETPHAAAFGLATAALAAAKIKATPVFALCEPIAGAAPDKLAWLEALALEPALAALVVAAEDRERAARVVGEAAPGARVVVDVSGGSRLPAWAEALFPIPTDEAGAVALGALSAAVEQAIHLGAVPPLSDEGLLTHRGSVFSPPREQPRLLGREARRAAHCKRLEAARADFAAKAAAALASGTAWTAAERQLELARGLVAAIGSAGSAEISRAEALFEAAAASAATHAELAAEAGRRGRAAELRAGDQETVLAALRARADRISLDELQAKIAELEAIAKRERQGWRDLQAKRGGLEAERASGQRRRDILDVEGSARADALATLGEILRGLVPTLSGTSDAALERWVCVTGGGDRFKSIETIEARVRDCERAEEIAADELIRDGSRGVRNIQFAARFGFGYERADNRLADRRDQPAANVLADLERTIAEQQSVITEENRELMETLVMGSLARDLQGQIDRLEGTLAQVNRLLGGIRFGRTSYQFKATPSAERRELVDVVRRISVLDTESRVAFRRWIESRMDELRGGDGDSIPDILDYRTWYAYRLCMQTEGTGGVDLTRSVRALGSGGEQGVPNYLLVLSLARLMFDGAEAKLRPLLFDEAFYGIDASRRDQLLRFATELGLQLLVASPDQDGVTPSVRAATTLFIVKDAGGDVHVAPYHYWHDREAIQTDIFAAKAQKPSPLDAECRTGSQP